MNASLVAGTLVAISNAMAEARLHLIVKWCQKRHVTVTFTSLASKYFPTSRRININKNVSRKRQLMVLLHECGHHLIDSSPTATDRYKNGWGVKTIKASKTDLHRIDVLEEEYEAWQRGWKLGKRLQVLTDADRPAFDKVRVSTLKSYANWIVNPSDYE